MYIRLSKIILMLSVALLLTVIVFNNLTDYGANYQYIAHVMSMDTIFPDSPLRWRAITATPLHHAAYIGLIATETITAILCWWGTIQLYRSRQDAKAFNQAKGIAVLGLTVGIFLWFTGFMTIAGEWFAMWQSATWNAQQPAFRFIMLLGFVLIFLTITDDESVV